MRRLIAALVLCALVLCALGHPTRLCTERNRKRGVVQGGSVACDTRHPMTLWEHTRNYHFSRFSCWRYLKPFL